MGGLINKKRVIYLVRGKDEAYGVGCRRLRSVAERTNVSIHTLRASRSRSVGGGAAWEHHTKTGFVIRAIQIID